MSGRQQQLLELLYYSVHSILFHRSVYTREEFDLASKYGETQYILADPQVRRFIDTFLAQVDAWIETGDITHMVMIIIAKDDGRTLERWTFDITNHENSLSITGPGGASTTTSATNGPSNDIAVPNVLRQLTAAISVLPDLPSPAIFNLQAYVASEDRNLPGSLPEQWEESTDTYPFGEDVEIQQSMLRGVKTQGREINLLLTSLDD
ncbi:Mitotic spindle checkpoint component mad2 [Serendipita sp. 396]|nr:Mitotic spindle checkpoint component mad2 [Serendipita sp. 396]KAG8771731.1 Mitotic spindle checkpoint component mad2 [Serendipita sp. 397]KAG8793750.1 Mitotic spindle checkpoint component mad2 [Serendipita sp. 398]KAG8817596.1 Mitotic spindle checkpoint component mad2 [Serendipita sp. 401]KAG8819479.1 Mitotic spindle checkpoint component mad2 [Serendipita sp. 400]KAG8855556.1 Mitotic spindle checkpoint component mad2 [Serendipita sp. 405]